MYRKSNESPLTPEKFELPVSVKLSPDNRWVIMAELIPWSELARSLAPDGGAGSLVNLRRNMPKNSQKKWVRQPNRFGWHWEP